MKIGLVDMDENPADAPRIVRAADRAGPPGVHSLGPTSTTTAVVDWALVYPPHFGVNQDRVHANEPSLIEVASGWTS
jgi:hypothetical protein